MDLIKSKKIKSDQLLPPVFPIVVYNGQRHWKAKQEIRELIEPMPASLVNYRPALKYFLLDEGNIRKKQISPNTGLAGMLIRLEQSDTPGDLQAIVKELIVKLKGREYLSLRRAFTVWIRRVIWVECHHRSAERGLKSSQGANIPGSVREHKKRN